MGLPESCKRESLRSKLCKRMRTGFHASLFPPPGFLIVGALLRASVAPGNVASLLPECLTGGVELFLAL